MEFTTTACTNTFTALVCNFSIRTENHHPQNNFLVVKESPLVYKKATRARTQVLQCWRAPEKDVGAAWTSDWIWANNMLPSQTQHTAYVAPLKVWPADQGNLSASHQCWWSNTWNPDSGFRSPTAAEMGKLGGYSTRAREWDLWGWSWASSSCPKDG